MGLGNKVRELRKKLGYNQRQLAEATGISQGYISQVETEDLNVTSIKSIMKLAKGLEVEPDELIEAAGLPTARQIEKRYQYYRDGIHMGLLEYLHDFSKKEQIALLTLLKAFERRPNNGSRD